MMAGGILFRHFIDFCRINSLLLFLCFIRLINVVALLPGSSTPEHLCVCICHDLHCMSLSLIYD